MTNQQRIIECLQQHGGIVVPAKTTRYVCVEVGGLRYFIGRLGAIRQGMTASMSRSVDGITVQGKQIVRSDYGPQYGAGGWDY